MTSSRRTYGTGNLQVREDSAGRETFYERFYAPGRQVRVRIGRSAGTGRLSG